MSLRQIVIENLELESHYPSLKIENTMRGYKEVVAGFFVMGLFSILIPLVVLLYPPANGEYVMYNGEFILSIGVHYIAIIALTVFMLSTLLVMWLIFRNTKE